MGRQHENGKGKIKGNRKRKQKPTYDNRISTFYCTLLVKELLLFSTVPVSIEMVMPIRTANTIHLMVALAIHAFEDVRTRLSFFGSHSICFLVFHATLCFLSVMFSNVSSIALGTPGDVRTTTECQVIPFPAVLTLWNTCCSNHYHSGQWEY